MRDPETAAIRPDIESNPQLLLVDDNPTNLQVLYRTLEPEGYDLVIAQSGEEALRVAPDAQPALILLDIKMPGIGGFETCRRLKADPQTRHAGVIFMSALNDSNAKVRGFELGAVDYITKPFDAAEVRARIRTHLELQRQNRELAETNETLAAANLKLKRDLEAAAKVRYVCAGHPPPVLIRGSEVISLDNANIPIGMVPETEYVEEVVELLPGDRLYLHSDGFLAEISPGGDEFGLERLQNQLLSTRNLPLPQTVDALIDAVVAWRGGTTLSDDVTAVGIERLPAQESVQPA